MQVKDLFFIKRRGIKKMIPQSNNAYIKTFFCPMGKYRDFKEYLKESGWTVLRESISTVHQDWVFKCAKTAWFNNQCDKIKIELRGGISVEAGEKKCS